LGQNVISLIEAVLSDEKIPHVTGKTWTTDAVYRETRKRTDARKQEGCIAVEMECAIWAAVSSSLGASFGQILYAGD